MILINGRTRFQPAKSTCYSFIAMPANPDSLASSPATQATTGDALFSQGQFAQALACFLAAQQQYPEVAEYAYRAGLALWRLGQHNAARPQYERAIRLNPDYAAAHGELGRVLLAMGRIEQATHHASRAVELAPTDSDLAIALASVLEADRQPVAALVIVDRLSRQGVETTDLAMVQSRLALRGGGEAAALALIERLLNKSPPLTPREQSALHFSAANLVDRMGRYDDAFSHASVANALRGVHYDPVQTERSFQNFIDYFTNTRVGRLSKTTGSGDLSCHPAPVFVVGMPRSGTSLVEQILASHPNVHGAGELDWIARIFESAVQRGARGAAPSLKSLDGLSAADVNDLARDYLQPLSELNPQALRITDKMPMNFIYLGLIAMLFPLAKIIHCRRDPLDTCLSCFMTDFAAGYEFSFSLASLGHFYRQYDRMMSHWKSVLPLPMLEVEYEHVVGDIEKQTRRMLEYVGLPWDEKCLQFHANPRFVGTASNNQVRRTVYRSSVGRWRHYEAHLTPLKDSLDRNSRF